MSIVITQQRDPHPPEQPREYAVYSGLVLNWQVRAIEELARQLGTYEDEIVMAALSLFLSLHSDRIELREAALFTQEAPGKIARTVRTVREQARQETRRNRLLRKVAKSDSKQGVSK